jgi:hypothetical protein
MLKTPFELTISEAQSAVLSSVEAWLAPDLAVGSIVPLAAGLDCPAKNSIPFCAVPTNAITQKMAGAGFFMIPSMHFFARPVSDSTFIVTLCSQIG